MSGPALPFAVAEETFSLLIAPDALLLDAIERQLQAVQRFRLLYVCGNYSRFLTRLGRTCRDFDLRRAFTAHQLLTILEEADQSCILIEHDPTLYDDAPGMAGPVARACADCARDARVVVLATAPDAVLWRMSADAGRVAYVCPPGGNRSSRHAGPAARRPAQDMPGRT
ncbi:MAG: hypothetical protein GKC04_08545 [Methanomicrobiales archaeon]|nr:hypothetical protein [Methanomicrobiales archaeon]